MMQSNEVAPESGASCGARLGQAREQAGLTLEQVAARLKVPTRVVQSLEADDTARLGAPIFVRGHLRSYARLLGIDIEADLDHGAAVPPVVPPELVSHSHVPRYRRMFDQVTRRAVYIVLTAAIALPVWLTTRQHLESPVTVQPLDVPGELADAGSPAPQQSSPPELARPASANPPPAGERKPLMASITSLQQPLQPPAALSLELNGESWVQVFDRNGEALEQGLLSAGAQLEYDEGEVGRVVLGNTAVVELRQHGEPVDLEPFSRANVARFTLSSDGSLVPVER
jgi:cytoskeleton protein RodZ